MQHRYAITHNGNEVMNWDDVKLALAVARTGSLNRAAQLLGVNQSTVSRRLTALEADLATTLFKRSRQGLVPTDAGAGFVRRAADIEARTEALVEATQNTDSRPAGVVRLVGNQWIIDQLLRGGLARFLADNPEIEIRTIAGRPETSLWRGEPGIGLWFEASPVDDAFSVRLGAVPYAVFQKRGGGATAWVAFHDEDHPASAAKLAAYIARDPGTPVRLTALDATTLREAVADGVGKALLPVCMGGSDPRLERVGSGAPEVTRILHVHAHPDTIGSPRIEALLDWTRRNFDRVFASG